MEITKNVLSIIAQTNPGHYAVYRLENQRLLELLRAPSLPDLFGMSQEEYALLVKDDALSAVSPRDRAYLSAALALLTPDSVGTELHCHITHRAKGVLGVHIQARCIGTMEGDPVFSVSYQDSSKGDEDYQKVLDQSTTALHIVDLDSYELLYANEPALRFWTLSDYSGKICHKAIYGLEEPCSWCLIPQLKDGFFQEDAFYDPGMKRWHSIRAQEMIFRGRRALAIYAYDITKEKTQQHDLEVDKQALELIVDHIPIGLGVCTLHKDQILSVITNQKLTALVGLGADAFLRRESALLSQIHPEDVSAVLGALRECKSAPHSKSLDYRFRFSPSAEYRWYRLLLSSIPQGDGVMLFACLTDVSEEKTAVVEALKSRRMYQTAAMAGKLIVWDYDPLSHRVTMLLDSGYTKAVCKKLDLPEIMEDGPQFLASRIQPQDRPAFLEMYHQIDRGARSASCTFALMGKEDNLVYFEATCTALYDHHNSLLTICGTARDITNKHLEQDRFRRAFQQIMAANPEAIGTFRHNLTTNWTGDGQGVFSSAFRMAASGTMDAHMAALAALIEEEECRIRFTQNFNREHLLSLFSQGKTHDFMECPLRLPDGRRLWVRATINMIRNPETGDVEAISYAADISDQKWREEIARCVTKNEFDYISVIYLSDETFEFYHKSSRISYPALHQRVSYQDCRNALIEHHIQPTHRAQFEEATSLAVVVPALRQKGRHESSYLRTENGMVERLQLRYTWLDEISGQILLVRTNVTAAYEQERRQLQTVQDALRQAEYANAAKSNFLSRMSHDLRTPLNGIIGLTDLALRDTIPPTEITRYLGEIHRSGNYLLGIINDVLDMSRIESNRLELHPEALSFQEFFTTLRDMIDIQCAEKQQIFEIVAPQDASAVYIRVDKTRFFQIFVNLLTNSVKYTPPGGHIALIIERLSQQDGRFLERFTVKDSGIGMSEAFLAHAFEPFAREHEHDGQAGTGLGLSIVKNLVDLMGGNIQIQSRPGCGTSVVIELLLEAAAHSDLSPPSLMQNSTLAGGHFLLCEDNRINAEIVVHLLENASATVDHAENGMLGLSLFAASKPAYYDAILMDIRMPELDGFETTKAIRALHRPDAASVPIIALTANAFDQDRMSCLAAGMNEHLSKPIDPDHLLRTLLRYRNMRSQELV